MQSTNESAKDTERYYLNGDAEVNLTNSSSANSVRAAAYSTKNTSTQAWAKINGVFTTRVDATSSFQYLRNDAAQEGMGCAQKAILQTANALGNDQKITPREIGGLLNIDEIHLGGALYVKFEITLPTAGMKLKLLEPGSKWKHNDDVLAYMGKELGRGIDKDKVTDDWSDPNIILEYVEDTQYQWWYLTKKETVAFDPNGGVWNDGTTNVKSDHIIPGNTMAVPGTVSRDGYDFDGWASSDPAYADLAVGDAATPAIQDFKPVTYSAKWQGKTYTIRYNDNGLAGAAGTVADQTYVFGTPGATLTNDVYTSATKNQLGWSLDAGAAAAAYLPGATIDDALKNALLDSAAGEVTLYAIWADKTAVKMTFDSGDGAFADGSTEKEMPVLEGQQGTLPAPPTREGYDFDGWKSGDTNTYPDLARDADKTPAAVAGKDAAYTAKWALKAYTIVFNANDAAAEGTMNDQTYNVEQRNAKLTANGFTHDTKDFGGWSTTQNGTAQFANEVPIEGALKQTILNAAGGTLTLYAVWQNKPDVNVEFDSGDGTWGDGTSGIKTVPTTPGQTAAIPGTVSRPGYELTGWASSDPTNYPNLGAADTVTPAIKAATPVKYTPTWQAKQYTIQYDKNLADATGTVAEQTYVFGTAGATVTNELFTSPTKNQLGWALSAASATAGYGKGALIDDALKNAMTASANGEVTLYAVWEDKDAVNMTFNAGEGEFPGGGKEVIEPVKPGQQGNLPAAPSREGYDFDGWKSGDANTYPDLDKNATHTPPAVDGKDVGYTAKWTRKSYTIHFEKTLQDAEGTMNDQPYNVEMANAKLPANTFTHPTKTFAGWTTGVLGSTPQFADEAAIQGTLKQAILNAAGGTLTLYAVWEDKTYNVTFETGQNGSFTTVGDPLASQQVTHGQSVAGVPAITANGSYTFSGWQVNGVGTIYSDAEVQAMPITADTRFVAAYVYHGGGSTNGYIIRASAGDGGAISPSGRVRVSRGADKSFRITPDRGYRIADVLVDGKSVGAVSQYTFENVRSDHTIEAVFVKGSAVADPTQTGVAGWLQTEHHIAYLNGHRNGTFGPNSAMTRAQAAQMFYNLLLDKAVDTTVRFTDVAENAWYAPAVHTLASLGVIEGIGNGKFAPDRAITRAEFTAMAMRFTKGTASGENPFSDMAKAAWYYDAVTGAAGYGWIGGYEDGTFRPNATITRAEVAAIVNRMLARSADTDFVDGSADLIRFPDVRTGTWYYYEVMEAANGHEHHTRTGAETWTALISA